MNEELIETTSFENNDNMNIENTPASEENNVVESSEKETLSASDNSGSENLDEATAETTAASEEAPKKKKKRKKKASAADELDIDFDNFEVPDDRAEKIRSLVQLVKEQGMIEGLSILVKEKGIIEEQEATENGEFPQIKYKKGQEPRIYVPYPLHPCFGFALRMEVNQIEIRWGEKQLLEVTLLPKEKEYIVQYVNETLWEEISDKLSLLNSEISEARKIKAEKQKAWKARFGS